MTMETARPFTPRTLAERWACSQGHIYNMIATGKLRGFRVGGRLVRISVEEVLRWENGQANQNIDLIESESIGSTGTSINSPPSGARMGRGTAIDLASQRRTKLERNLMRSHVRTPQ